MAKNPLAPDENGNVSVDHDGWFCTCLDCRCTFFRIIPKQCTVEDGKILQTIFGGADDGKVRCLGTIKCPDCLSDNVQSVDL